MHCPPQVADLIGVKDRGYPDRTGLQQHRGIVELMRNATPNQSTCLYHALTGHVRLSAQPGFSQSARESQSKVCADSSGLSK
jgi:hypothetical protein